MNSFIKTLVLALLVSVAPLDGALGKGIVLYKEHDAASDEFWKPLAYEKARIFAASINFKVAGRIDEVLIPKNEVGLLVELPDVSNGSYINETEFAVITAKRQELEQLAKRCKTAAPTLLATAQQYKNIEAQFAAGNVILNGKWLSAEQWKREQIRMNPVVKTLPTLIVGDQTYKEARLTSIRGSSIGIIHAGGINTVPISSLSDDQIKQLNSTSNLKIDKSAPQPAVVAAPSKQEEPAAPKAPVDPVVEERLRKLRTDLANVQATIEEQRLRWDQAYGIINSLTNFKRMPVREGSPAHIQCLDAAKVIDKVEQDAPRLTEKKENLEAMIDSILKEQVVKTSQLAQKAVAMKEQEKALDKRAKDLARQSAELDRKAAKMQSEHESNESKTANSEVQTPRSQETTNTKEPISGPSDDIIIMGLKHGFNSEFAGPFRRGQILISNGGVAPIGTKLYPVKIEIENGSATYYYFQDEFSDWFTAESSLRRAWPSK